MPFLVGRCKLKVDRILCITKNTGAISGLFCKCCVINCTYFRPEHFLWNIPISTLLSFFTSFNLSFILGNFVSKFKYNSLILNFLAFCCKLWWTFSNRLLILTKFAFSLINTRSMSLKCVHSPVANDPIVFSTSSNLFPVWSKNFHNYSISFMAS